MSEINFEPIGDRVVILPFDPIEVKKSGLIVPAESKEKPDQGRVICVGKGTEEFPVTVAPGDVVLYGKDTGMEITLEDKKYIILRNIELYGKIPNKK